MADERSYDWDWVKAKHECNAVAMFETLKRLAQRDVERRNEQDQGHQFHYQELDGIQFSVSRDAQMPGRVYFQVDDDLARVYVRQHPADGIFYIVRLNDEGQCKFRREGTEEDLDAWRVLQLALEPLLFA